MASLWIILIKHLDLQLLPLQPYYQPQDYNKDEVGFLAQEVQQILPIIVKDSYYKNISYKKLNETKIIAYLINVIKNIHNRIEILEKNI